MNVFNQQPEFISLDPRSKRPKGLGYAVNPDFMLARHTALIPPDLIKGKRVLDLGSCLAATGAWCLSSGASFYMGVEIDEEFFINSTNCLKKYYPPESWSIQKSSIEDFLSRNKEKYDVLIASGVMYGSENPTDLLKSFSKCADFLIIESVQMPTIFNSQILSLETLNALNKDPRIAEFLDSESYISVGQRGMVTSGEKSVLFSGFNPNMGAVKFILTQLGFSFSEKPNLDLRKALPEQYSPIKRFALHFRKDANSRERGFGLKNALQDAENNIITLKW